MLHCIAVDDEPLSLDVISAYSKMVDDMLLVATFTSTARARQYLENNTVDLIFLDIEMADIDGLSFYRSLEAKPMVIFTTAYSNYAVQGFDLSATDYLLKPILPERFIQAMHKAFQLRAFKRQITDTGASFLQIRAEYQTMKIPIADILYIEGLNNHVKIYTVNSTKPVLSMITMKEILGKLPAGKFVRVHRSYIIHVPRVTSYTSRHVFINGKPLPIGDTYRNVTGQLKSPAGDSPLF